MFLNETGNVIACADKAVRQVMGNHAADCGVFKESVDVSVEKIEGCELGHRKCFSAEVTKKKSELKIRWVDILEKESSIGMNNHIKEAKSNNPHHNATDSLTLSNSR